MKNHKDDKQDNLDENTEIGHDPVNRHKASNVNNASASSDDMIEAKNRNGQTGRHDKHDKSKDIRDQDTAREEDEDDNGESPHTNVDIHDNSNDSIDESFSGTDRDNRSRSSNNNRVKRNQCYKKAQTQEDEDQLDITVNPDEDYLDGARQGTIGSVRGKYGGARPKSPRKQKSDMVTPKRQKKSVASRLLGLSLSTPTNRTNKGKKKQNPILHDDDLFDIDSQKADRELKEAQQLHSEREAELARHRLEAEELWKRSIQVQKQVAKDNKKAEQSNTRYVRQNKKLNTETDIIEFENLPYPHNIVGGTKRKVKALNPIRRARNMYTGTDRSNNPNVAGQDNGNNAWLDTQLNEEDFDLEMKVYAKYAKRNSDRNKCYDIDDMPIRGPPNCQLDDDIQSVISIGEATNTANTLLNYDEMYICSKTGIMKRKDSR